MADVPESILKEFDENPGGTTTESWLRSLDKREMFEATVRLYLERRGEGQLRMSLGKFLRIVKVEFGYPFGTDCLRMYMLRTHPDLFERQKR